MFARFARVHSHGELTINPQNIEASYSLHSNVLQTASNKRKVTFKSYLNLPSKQYKVEVNAWTGQEGNQQCLPIIRYLEYRERKAANPPHFQHKIRARAGLITTFYSTT